MTHKHPQVTHDKSTSFETYATKSNYVFLKASPSKMRNVLKQIDCTKLVTNVLRVWTNQTLQFRLFQFCNFTVPSWKYIHTLLTGQVNLISKCPCILSKNLLPTENTKFCALRHVNIYFWTRMRMLPKVFLSHIYIWTLTNIFRQTGLWCCMKAAKNGHILFHTW